MIKETEYNHAGGPLPDLASNNHSGNHFADSVSDRTGFHVRRNFKDSLFRFLFSEKEAALELYNALNGSSYTDPDILEITTIEDVIYIGVKNDLAFLVEGRMHLVEAQSTWSPNMPLRGLFYFAGLYKGYVAKNQLDVYARTKLSLPSPVYIVFYNGGEDKPEQSELRLSDSFTEHLAEGEEPAVEVVARVLNITYGKNRALMERCQKLHDYAYLLRQVDHHLAMGLILKVAVDRAVQDCIQQDVMREFLLKHRAEVCDMIMTEYDAMLLHINSEKKESFQEGREAGIREGREVGLQEGIQTGLRQGREEMILAMLANGADRELVKRCAVVTDQELDEILQKNK